MMPNIPLPLTEIKDTRVSLWISFVYPFRFSDEYFTYDQILKMDCYIDSLFSEVNYA